MKHLKEGDIFPKIVLVSLPWAPYAEPSLGLAILKATLREQGISCEVLHATLGLLRHLTAETYGMLASFWGINEFVFTGTLDDSFDEMQAECLVERCKLHAENSQHAAYKTPEALVDLCMRLRDDIIPMYLRECANRILDYGSTAVGLTCMFDQTLASVALAKILKAEDPDLFIFLGGYAMEGPSGVNILRSFPWIDAVARGDGEPIIARLAAASVGAEAVDSIPGVLTASSNGKGLPAVKIDMDTSPLPDYSSWFTDLKELEQSDHITVQSQVLPVEASRGCWWGQKKHCIFCGIDEETLKYRAKAPENVVNMLKSMRSNYGDYPFRFSDYILPKQYYKEVLDKLAEITPPLRLMGEMKANQNLSRLHRFAKAGFIELQPGIESFSSEVLQLMNKGVRGIDNVLTLKGGYLYGIQINYNILYGLPGEEVAWYRQMVKQIPLLYHFTPPVSRTETIVTRFAPLQADPNRFKFDQKAHHHRCYDVLFSQSFLQEHNFSLDDHAYYFERNFPYGDGLANLYAMVVIQIEYWKRQHREREVYLYYIDILTEEVLEIFDSRFGQEEHFKLSGLDRQIYLACDLEPIVEQKLHHQLLNEATDEEIKNAISYLEERRLLWREGSYLLGVAVPQKVWIRHQESGWTRKWTANYC